MNHGVISKYFSGTNTFFARLAESIQRFRWLLLLMVLLTTIFAFYQMKTIRMDNSNESFFLEGDPTKFLLDKFRDTFGNDDFVYEGQKGDGTKGGRWFQKRGTEKGDGDGKGGRWFQNNLTQKAKKGDVGSKTT